MAKKDNGHNSWIHIHGAKEHNLKNIDISIPKEQLVVVTGPSGSGKSSLVLDILYTEGKRRYLESLSSYARQFLGVPKKPDVDSIVGLCPSIAIEQKTVGSNPRSTVGTITEIYDYLRILYARIGTVHCPNCMQIIKEESPENVAALVLEQFEGQEIIVAAPVAIAKKGEFTKDLVMLFNQGFYRLRIDGVLYRFKSVDEVNTIKLPKKQAHTIEVMIDSIPVNKVEQSRINEAVETAFKVAGGACTILVGDRAHQYSMHRMCVSCGESVPEIEPRLFSFNSPIGACSQCEGLGVIQRVGMLAGWESLIEEGFSQTSRHIVTCPGCNGQRLNKYALAILIGDQSIVQLSHVQIAELQNFFQELQLSSYHTEIARELIKEIKHRLRFLMNVGLSYLTLSRTARTLSGGEGQRIRLATQIGCALSGVLYVLDEPSIGLHQRDNDRLIETLKNLRDLGNTVVVVEHDIDTIQHADYVVDMGPAAGVLGGEVTAFGTPDELMRNKQSLTGAFLSGERMITVPETRRKPTGFMILHHATRNNLKDITVRFPLGVMCGISGVSGSGKSSLIMQELLPELHRTLSKTGQQSAPSQEMSLTGADSLRYCVVIDQTPIGRTPRSTPASYLGIFDPIRTLFASTPEANARGYKSGRFSFNVAEGRCYECRGDGHITVEMHFLPPVTTVCRSCKGKRYNAETLQIRFKGKTIEDVLNMTAYEALDVFKHHAAIEKRLSLLCDVGLDYLKLGQPSTTLSGGEAQRIKLVDELAKRGSQTLYILDEPTTGLHSSDIERLLGVLNNLVDKGNSMIVIEHNLDVLKTVDYLIDLGPDGGNQGGEIVAYGTPEQVSVSKDSITARYLAPLLKV